MKGIAVNMKNNESKYFYYSETEEKSLINQMDIYQIYNRFLDDISKQIFADRLFFSLTNDWRYIKNMLIETGCWSGMEKALTIRKGIPIYIYGAGRSGSRLPLIFPEYLWQGYIDKIWGGNVNNLPVYGIEKCKELSKEALILISNMTGEKEIRKELLMLGVLEENIISFIDYTKKAASNIYFDNKYIQKELIKDKAFVDAGAYDGIDSIHFINWINHKNAKVIVFEADKDNFKVTKKNLSVYPKISLYNQGLSDVVGQELFFSGKGEVSNFSVLGNKITEMNTLDNITLNEKVGYIKMDIEGFEKRALKGAKRMIAEQKPALAISIYHKREDIWELPKLILDMNPDYKFSLRHYSLGVADTVLYAT